MALPEDVAVTHPDRGPGDTAHQQHHDAVHTQINILTETGTEGQVVTKQGDGSIAFGDIPQNWVRFWPGSWLLPMIVSANQVCADGKRSWHPFHVPYEMEIDALGIRCEGVGSAGSVTRLGIYEDDDGYPGALLMDAGDQPTDAIANVIAPLVPTLVVPAGMYWMAAHTTVAATGNVFCCSHTSPAWGLLGGFPQSSIRPGTVWISGYLQSGIAPEALPATAPAGMSAGRFATWVGARVA